MRFILFVFVVALAVLAFCFGPLRWLAHTESADERMTRLLCRPAGCWPKMQDDIEGWQAEGAVPTQ